MFRTGGLIFRKTVVLTVVVACVLHGEITVNGVLPFFPLWLQTDDRQIDIWIDRQIDR